MFELIAGGRLDTGSGNSNLKSKYLYVSVCPNDHLCKLFFSHTKMEKEAFSYKVLFFLFFFFNKEEYVTRIGHLTAPPKAARRLKNSES